MRGTAVKRNRLAAYVLAFAFVVMGKNVFAQADRVKVQQDPKAKELTVKIGDEVFTVFHFSPEWPKPFASPVYGPGGVVMTRAIPKQGDKVDHPVWRRARERPGWWSARLREGSPADPGRRRARSPTRQRRGYTPGRFSRNACMASRPSSPIALVAMASHALA